MTATHDFNAEPDGMDIKEIASQRWQAVEAFNTMPGLSAVARRLGVALICMMDSRTRACFPGEERLAATLGVHVVSIKKAKAELKEQGLLDWYKLGGQRHVCHYGFAWSKLIEFRDYAKYQADKVIEQRVAERSQRSPQATMTQRNSSLQATLQRSPQATMPVTNDARNVVKSGEQRSQIEEQGSLQATYNVAPRLPELSHLSLPLDMAQHSTTFSQTSGGAALRNGNSDAAPRDPVFEDRAAAPKKGAQEKKEARPRCPYPTLITAFKDDKATLEALYALNSDRQQIASSNLAMRGPEAAKAIIMKGSQ